MSFFKKIIKKLIYGYSNSAEKIEKLRKSGVKIGDGVHLYDPFSINIDTTRPFAIQIGNNVHITSGVTILTHGFDHIVLKSKYNDVFGSFGKVQIDDNVYIGTNALILKGVHIHSNVIIGAGSVVTKDCESDSVYAGVPARRICSLEEHYEKRKNAQLKEALELFKSYYERYNQIPDKKIFSEFFYLFEDRNLPLLEEFKYQMNNNGNYEICENEYLSGKGQHFESYEKFIDYCFDKLNIKK